MENYIELKKFTDCKFNREPYATQIINLIKREDKYMPEFDSLVLALDSPWGTGKTTFLKMLENKIIDDDEKICVVKYNTWENDFQDNALESLLYNITSSNLFESEVDAANLKSFGTTVLNILGSVAKNAASKHLGSEVVEYASELLNSTNNFAIGDIPHFKEIQERIKLFEAFKTDFERLILGRKVLVIIDELDRCKPTFAIQTLEFLKHLFNIKDVSFLLALDMEQLRHSIATVYGQNMNSEGYINRFINYILRLPEPNKLAYVDYLLATYDLGNFEKEAEAALSDLRILLSIDKLSIRDINIIFRDYLYYCGSDTFSNFDTHSSIVYLYLMVIKYCDSELFTAYKRGDAETMLHGKGKGPVELKEQYRFIANCKCYSHIMLLSKPSKLIKMLGYPEDTDPSVISSVKESDKNQEVSRIVSQYIGKEEIQNIKKCNMLYSTYFQYVASQIELFTSQKHAATTSVNMPESLG